MPGTRPLADLIEDNGQRGRAEQALRESVALLRAICDSAADLVFAKDREGRLLLTNPATLALLHRAEAEVLGKTDVELWGEAIGRRIMESDRRIMESGVPSVLEERIPDRTGEPRIWLSMKSPYRDATGNVIGVLGIVRDITERTRYEEALRQSQAQLSARATELETILASMAEGVVVYDLEGRIVRLNAAAERLTGYLGADLSARFQERATRRTFLSEAGQPIRVEDLPVARALRGETVTGVLLGKERPGSDLQWTATNAAPLVDASGRITGAVATFADMTDRKRMEEALREADRRKDEFLAVLSHELRNPLAPIRSSLYILDHAVPTGERARRAMAVIGRQVGHLTRLVDDLLDVTRIARGKIELRRERIDLGDIVRRAGEDHRSVLTARGVKLVIDVPDEAICVDGDATRLAQIIGNLLQNAGKFTGRDGQVTLALTAAGDAAEVRVRDTGIGIEPGLLAQVFEPFVQAERSLARSQGGLGLGLALVKGLTALHGGTVRAESAGPSGGAEFIVHLPVVAAALPERARDAGALRGGGGRHVLVVDDNVDAAETLAELVAMFGHRVEIAHDGPSALAKARTNPPDVVLCDIGLPGMNGYEVARALRAEGASEARLVAVSGYARPEDRKKAADAGFDCHIAKPPDPDDIERLLL